MGIEKSKRMKILSGIVAVCLVGSLASTAFAAWSVTGEIVNQLTTLVVRGAIEEEYVQNQTITTNQVVGKKVWVKNTGTADAIVRAKVSYGFDDGTEIKDSDIAFTYNNADWTYDNTDGYYYYKAVLKPGDKSTDMFDSFTLDKELGNEVAGKSGHIVVDAEFVQAANDGPSYWNKTYENLGVSYVTAQVPDTTTAVSFVSSSAGFIFSDANGLFTNFYNLVPGDTRSQKITVSNTSSNTVRIYLRADVADYGEMDAKTKQLVDELMKKYTTITITDSKGNVWYTGKVWGNLDVAKMATASQTGTGTSGTKLASASIVPILAPFAQVANAEEQPSTTMYYDMPIGTFSPNTSETFNVSLYYDKGMTDSYSSLLGKVKWIFTAEGVETENTTSTTVPAKTGLDSFVQDPVILASGISSICFLVALAIAERKKKQEIRDTKQKEETREKQ